MWKQILKVLKQVVPSMSTLARESRFDKLIQAATGYFHWRLNSFPET